MASNVNYGAVTAVATTTYPATAQVIAGFAGQVTLIHLGASNNITFSFDGTNDAGVLVPGTPAASLTTTGFGYGQVFLKGAAATSTDVEVIVESKAQL